MGDNTDLENDIVLEDIPKEETEGIALELLREVKEDNKRIASILKTTIRSFAISVILIIAIFLGVFLYFVHNFEIESYSQDGNGYNNINTGTQGDVINGAEISESQEEER